MVGNKDKDGPSHTEILQRSYSEAEVEGIYELARFCCESGQSQRADVIFNGLAEVSPKFLPALLGKCLVQINNQAYDAAVESAKKALKLDPKSVEAQIFLVTALLSVGDINSAGTLLGEIGERIEAGEVTAHHTICLYKGQLARYESRRQ